MMLADEIRNHRIQAEKDAAWSKPGYDHRIQAEKDAAWSKPGYDLQEETCYHLSRGVLALWTIAEQLYELRENFGMVIDGAAQIHTKES